LLPRIELAGVKKAIGTNTVSAMQSGMLYGYVGLVEGLVSRIQAELPEKAKVVATGGYARLLAEETSIFDAVNDELTLIGVRMIYLMNRV